jgi:ribosomal protein S27AE
MATTFMATTFDPTYCGACGAAIDEPGNTLPPDRKPCPSCGSLARNFGASMQETLTLREKLGLKHKRRGYKKPIYESISGDDLHRKSGEWNKLTREIDRENNRYREIIVNPTSGEVLRNVDEPLSEHTGRGSAKPKPGDGALSGRRHR